MSKFRIFGNVVDRDWSMAHEAIERVQGKNIAVGKLMLHPGDRYVWRLVCITEDARGILVRRTFSGEGGSEVTTSFPLDELIDYDSYREMLGWIYFCCVG